VYDFAHIAPHNRVADGIEATTRSFQANETASARLAEGVLPWLAATKRGLPEPMVLDPPASAAYA
jgi:hypothetical protein